MLMQFQLRIPEGCYFSNKAISFMTTSAREEQFFMDMIIANFNRAPDYKVDRERYGVSVYS